MLVKPIVVVCIMLCVAANAWAGVSKEEQKMKLTPELTQQFAEFRLKFAQHPGYTAMWTTEEERDVFRLLVSDLYANARLYIELLDWLVKPARRRRGETTDCVITLCAVALSMSGDALRLLWPV